MAEKKAASSRSKSGSRSGSGGSGRAADEQAELTAATEVRSAFISGNTFRAKAVQYVVVDGDAIFEGDIVLGTADQVERDTEVLQAELRGELESGVIITGDQFRWPNCTVPFDIDPALPDQARVTDAIAHWQTNTRFRFVPKTAAHADWVTFRPSSGCSSSVGRRGGQQFVNLGSGCSTGNTIHEIGHAVGMWHEQSREDRDAFVTINWANIQAGTEHNFNQHVSDGTDVGAYDYGSIMHYPRNAFGVNGAETITPTNPAAQIGQRTALSAGDIATANSMCPQIGPGTIFETAKELAVETVKERFPETLKERAKELVKEQIETLKERQKEIKEPVKEFKEFKEPVKERLETAKERIETIVEGGPTIAEGIGGGGFGGVGPVVNPAGPVINQGQLPFAMRTPTVGVPGDAGAVGQAGAGDEPLARLAALEDAVASIAQGQQELLAQIMALLGGGGDPSGGMGGMGGPCVGCM
jgi:hypothetical protein